MTREEAKARVRELVPQPEELAGRPATTGG